ncbi:MAG: 2-oxoacid:acceptor oxidoreductase family protein [Bradymonadales bacterium]
MSTHELIISGFGGQGVMSIGNTAAQLAMSEGYEVSWLPSYGPEMRGGTANCSVVMSTREIVSPIISQPSELIAMNKPSLARFEKSVRAGGIILINSSIIETSPERNDVRVVYVPSMQIAQELGNPRVGNMAMLGAYIEATKFLSVDGVEALLKSVFTGSKADLVALNLEALRRGAACV